MPTPLADKVPVTVLTGFLGAGKTTLLNRILTENHGLKIAVIENEYGEIGIDNQLVIQAEEEVFEMNNGCICCTVRGDLIRILGQLMRRRDRFDHIVIETTGLADPAPVAQTFFVDDELKDQLRLDGIVTLVDAHHIAQHLHEDPEAHQQIAFADVIVLNKTDLVDERALSELERELASLNGYARVERARYAELPIKDVIAVGGFDLDRALSINPAFLEPEYPFEWAGIYALRAGRHELRLAAGPDPSMAVMLEAIQGADLGALDAVQAAALVRFTEEGPQLPPGSTFKAGEGVRTLLVPEGSNAFTVEVPADGHYVLWTQHGPDEFALDLAGSEPVAERAYAGAHEHDEAIGSVGIAFEGALSLDKLNTWMGRLLREQGVDIFRMKGVLDVVREERRFVFQGVHMLFDGRPGSPWQPGERRLNQLVFIGRRLDRQALEAGVRACLA